MVIEIFCREGISPDKIYRVGNVMIDSLVRLLPVAMKCKANGFPASLRSGHFAQTIQCG